MTPHDKQVMMFSATLSKEIRPVCKKFMQEVVFCHLFFGQDKDMKLLYWFCITLQFCGLVFNLSCHWQYHNAWCL